MYHSTRELWVAFIAIVFISIIYLSAVLLLGGIPAASDFFGHTLGVAGFLLMLMTETLYTLRKKPQCPLGEAFLLVAVPYCHWPGRTIHGFAALILEV